MTCVARDTGVEASVGPSEGLPPWTFVTAERRIFALDFAIEELVSLKHSAAAALRVRPIVRHVKTGTIIPTWAYARLSDADMETIDRATVDFAGRLQPSPSEAKLPLIIPQSFRTLAGRRGRAALSAATKGSAQALKTRVIVELTDIDRGTPPGRLNEVSNLVGGVCKGVFARLQPGRDSIAPLRETRLQGLAFDVGDVAGAEADVAGALLEAGEQMQGLAPLLIAQGLASEVFFAVAEVAGFSHVALRAESGSAD